MAPNTPEANGKSPNTVQQPAVFDEQPPPVQQCAATIETPVAGAPGQWTTGLCGCFEDCSNCFVTCCCPCITLGQNVEIIERGTTSCAHAGIIYYCLAHVGFANCYSRTYRTKLRAYFNLPQEPCGDCFVHYCCHLCAVCQEYRELKNRGFDPSIGWIANAQKWQQTAGITVPPSVVPGMAR